MKVEFVNISKLWLPYEVAVVCPKERYLPNRSTYTPLLAVHVAQLLAVGANKSRGIRVFVVMRWLGHSSNS